MGWGSQPASISASEGRPSAGACKAPRMVQAPPTAPAGPCTTAARAWQGSQQPAPQWAAETGGGGAGAGAQRVWSRQNDAGHTKIREADIARSGRRVPTSWPPCAACLISALPHTQPTHPHAPTHPAHRSSPRRPSSHGFRLARSAMKLPSERAEPQGITCLVVDANPGSRAATLRLMEEAGFKVRGSQPPALAGGGGLRASPGMCTDAARAEPLPALQALACASGRAALELLDARAAAACPSGAGPGVHCVLKDQSEASNAVRFLHRLRERPALASVVPIGEPRPARPPPRACPAGLGARGQPRSPARAGPKISWGAAELYLARFWRAPPAASPGPPPSPGAACRGGCARQQPHALVRQCGGDGGAHPPAGAMHPPTRRPPARRPPSPPRPPFPTLSCCSHLQPG